MTAKKTETTKAEETVAAEPNTRVAAGKKKPELTEEGYDKVAQDGAAARNETMTPATGGTGHQSQAEIAADAKNG